MKPRITLNSIYPILEVSAPYWCVTLYSQKTEEGEDENGRWECWHKTVRMHQFATKQEYEDYLEGLHDGTDYENQRYEVLVSHEGALI